MRTRQNPPRNGEGDHAQHGGGGPRVLQVPIKQVKRARKLRRRLSLPEVMVWQVLRSRPNALKFRRQFPIGPFTADFACLDRRLIIEIDGETHGLDDQPKRDASRDALLRRKGFRVMRIAARNVLKDMDGIIRGIVAAAEDVGPLHQPAAGPPPRSGED